MKGRILPRLAIAAIIVASTVGTIGTATVPQLDSIAFPSAHPCVSDSDCPGAHICCPISGFCTHPRGCRKDPL